jgi:hypothetical protein
MKMTRRLGVRDLMAAMAVLAVACVPAPPAGTSHDPSGSLDGVSLWMPFTPNQPFTPRPDPDGFQGPILRVYGWASDWDSRAPIDVAIYLRSTSRPPGWLLLGSSPDGVPIVPFPANESRADVDAVFHRGTNFGFTRDFWMGGGDASDFDQRVTICVAAINVGPGINSLLGCKDIDIPPKPAS